MLEKDEAHRLHSNSACEVVQLRAHLDYLPAAPLVEEEEVAKARASATASWLRAYGRSSTAVNSYYLVFAFWP